MVVSLLSYVLLGRVGFIWMIPRFLAMAGRRKVGWFTAAGDTVLARTLWTKDALYNIWWKQAVEIMKYHRVGRCQMMVCQSSSLFSVRIGCCVWQSVRPPTAGSPFTFNIRSIHLQQPPFAHRITCEVCSPLLTFPGLRQDFVMYLNWVCVNQESCEIHESCLWRFRNGCPTEPTDRQMPQMSSREWCRTRLPQDKQGINRNIRPGSIMEQERVSWDVGMRLLARWYKVLLPHLTSYEECPFTSWVLGKILRSHLWLNQGVCFLWNLHDFWVNSHHIVTHFLTDFPVSWLTPFEGECLSLNSVAPWFWSTCRINMASRLSLKCLSATCCLQLST